jgi:hypothetical protein
MRRRLVPEPCTRGPLLEGFSVLRLRIAAGPVAGVCGLLLAGLPANAQISQTQSVNQPVAPAQATATQTATAPETPKPPAVYVPTSLAIDPDVPRTRDGHPDLQGAVWHANFSADFLNAAEPALVVPKERAKALSDQMQKVFLSFKVGLPPDPLPEGIPLVRGEYRTRLLVNPPDGKAPFTEAAQKELASIPPAMRPGNNNPEERNYMERCLFADEPPPRANMLTLGAREFIQTRDHIVIHSETQDEAHIIPFARRDTALPSYAGRSIARWEGDTLVVETTGVSEKARRRFLPAFIVNADAKVIERYTRVTKDELLYQFTVEDPKVYAAPWLAEYSLYRAAFRMYPSNCHEANYSLANILSGQRVRDNRTAGTAQ